MHDMYPRSSAGRVRQWLSAVQAAMIDGPSLAAPRYLSDSATTAVGSIFAADDAARVLPTGVDAACAQPTVRRT